MSSKASGYPRHNPLKEENEKKPPEIRRLSPFQLTWAFGG